MSRILKYKDFVINESLYEKDSILPNIPDSEIKSILDKEMANYLKSCMWRKSIEVFYGKEYLKKPDFQPQNDSTPIVVSSWFTGGESITAGKFFLDAWEETNQFCDRAVELAKTGEISDTWGKVGQVAGITALTAAGVAAIIATGGAILPGATLMSGFITAAGTAAWGVTAVNASALIALGYGAAEAFKDNPNINPELRDLAKLVANKDETIKKFNEALQAHSDFEGDWGLDKWLSGLQGMPGWNKSSWKDKGAESIGYLFSYWIAYYSYNFLRTKFGAFVAQLVKEYEKTALKTTEAPVPDEQKDAISNQTWVSNKDTTSTPTAEIPVSTYTATTSVPTSTQTTPSIQMPTSVTTSTPSGGVMGATPIKKSAIKVDDESVSKYGY